MTAFIRNGALAALAIAFVAGCTAKPPPSKARVVVAELRVPRAAAGEALVGLVPDAKDGQSNHNPPGTVEVFSTANLAFDPGDLSTNACSAPAVYAPVVVKNYTTESLSNVVVQFTNMNPTDHLVCNTVASPPAGVAQLSGLIGYGDLPGAAASDGSEPGYASTTTWWISYPNDTPFAFQARVWADVFPAPPTSPSPANGSAFCAADSGCGSALGILPVTLTWTSADATQGFVTIYSDASYTTSIESAVVDGTGTGQHSFSYDVTDQTPGQRWWRAVNRFAGTGGTVNGTFSTGGTYYVDGPPTNQKLYLYDPWWNYPHLSIPCALQLSDFDTMPTIAAYPSTQTTHSADKVIAYGETFAPLADFYTFGWWESWNGYPTHPRARPFSYAHNVCSDLTLGWMSGAAPKFALGISTNQVNLVDPVVGEYVYGVDVCNQYGTAFDPAHAGTCSTQVYRVADGDLPAAPYPVISPAAGTYATGTTISITGTGPFNDPAFAPVVFYYTTDGSDPVDATDTPTARAQLYSGPFSLPAGTYTVAVRGAGTGFHRSYNPPTSATYTFQ